MASKRVELAKQQQKLQGSVQINTNVDDAQKSIEELINAGVRTHEQNRSHFLQRKAKLPSSFYQPRIVGNFCKSRGSSVDHSREGSSDDGIGCSSGCHTLSPSSIANFSGIQNFCENASLPCVGEIIHQRQASAPALINCNMMEQQHFQQPQSQLSSQYDINRTISKSSTEPPLVAHACSRSLNTVTINLHLMSNKNLNIVNNNSNVMEGVYNTNTMHNPQLNNQLPSIAHQRSVKSCDFDTISAVAVENNMLNYDPFHSNQNLQQNVHPIHHQQHSQLHSNQQVVNMNFVTTAGDLATSDQNFYENKLRSDYWSNSRAKSQSLDPMTLSVATSPVLQQYPVASPQAMGTPGSTISINSSLSASQQQFLIQQQQNLGMASCSEKNMSDTFGSLPEGWAMAYDKNGDAYFIDHFNKTTTWFDPRLSKEAQKESIKMRHLYVQQQQSNSSNTNKIKQTLNMTHTQQQIPTTSTSLHHQMLNMQQQQHPSNTTQTSQTNAHFHNQHYNPITTSSPTTERMEQLKLKRNYTFERRQKICRDDFLNCAVTSQQQLPLNTELQDSELNFPVNPSVNFLDSAMEVDFQQNTPILHSGLHQIDPSFVQDLSAADLNPHEFDKYLQITDANRPFGVMR